MRRMKKDATYLGLPLFRSLNRSKDLHLLTERVLQRVKSWKSRLLSKAGRACLIQAVGSSMATYYIKGGNFLDIESRGSDSGMWKAVLQAQSILQKGLCRAIDASHGVSWVSQFILPNNRWNVDMVRDWFSHSDAHAILNVDLPEEDKEDFWIWLGENNGNFSIRSTCKLLKGGIPENDGIEIWKLIWHSPLHSRLKFLWWHLLRDALPTKGKLATILEGISDSCILCNEATESSLHLFWFCPFAKALWFQLGWSIRTELVNVQSWMQWTEWFKMDSNRPSSMSFSDFMAHTLCIVEGIWNERNRRLVGEKEMDILRVKDMIRLKTIDHIMVSSKAVPEILSWAPPPSSWLCCNSDVAISSSGSVLAAVFRDEWSNIIAIKTSMTNVNDPLLAEALAVCMAATEATSMGLNNIIFQSDNLNVVNEFQDQASPVFNIKIQCNFMAHNIAKWATCYKVSGRTSSDALPAALLDDLIEWNPGL
ncbi:hypothetical protein G4B88_007045 [Cannabis sativa]|uniref:Reverse transcriptase zinc-binding domain-containing protein n=1 Tax=Cannabis sativa TaxID=3483 RepID=A0A7J6FNK5_CANSA|nr:hypothetical protein G4B88_007045 [Cannabis sativa]